MVNKQKVFNFFRFRFLFKKIQFASGYYDYILLLENKKYKYFNMPKILLRYDSKTRILRFGSPNLYQKRRTIPVLNITLITG